MLNGLIIAGGRIDKEFADLVGTDYKCLIRVGSKPLVQYVFEALKGCEFIERIVVVRPKELKEPPLAKLMEAVIEKTGIGSENIRLGIEALGMSKKFCSCPLISH